MNARTDNNMLLTARVKYEVSKVTVAHALLLVAIGEYNALEASAQVDGIELPPDVAERTCQHVNELVQATLALRDAIERATGQQANNVCTCPMSVRRRFPDGAFKGTGRFGVHHSTGCPMYTDAPPIDPDKVR